MVLIFDSKYSRPCVGRAPEAAMLVCLARSVQPRDRFTWHGVGLPISTVKGVLWGPLEGGLIIGSLRELRDFRIPKHDGSSNLEGPNPRKRSITVDSKYHTCTLNHGIWYLLPSYLGNWTHGVWAVLKRRP